MARVAFGTDESTALTGSILGWLRSEGHDVDVVASDDAWVTVGEAVGQAVADGRAEVGVVCCWTGTGVSIAANKVPGVRAALCHDAETAAGSRRWNDANVLALSLRATAEPIGAEILEAFFTNDADPDEAGEIARLG